MSESLYTNVKRIVWREHAKGPGVATFEYADAGHDHREMSQYQAANLAASLGMVDLQGRYDIHEWVRL
jgi:hypothetical protein